MVDEIRQLIYDNSRRISILTQDNPKSISIGGDEGPYTINKQELVKLINMLKQSLLTNDDTVIGYINVISNFSIISRVVIVSVGDKTIIKIGTLQNHLLSAEKTAQLIGLLRQSLIEICS